MNTFCKFLALLSLTILTACAINRPQLSRQEYLDMTNRNYENTNKEEVFIALEKLFRLADGDDFSFYYTENEMQAVREWSFYLILAAGFGTDFWNISIEEIENNSKVTVAARTQSQGVAPMPTTGGDFTAGTMPVVGSPVKGTAIYDVFWARLDYLLGKRADWMTCKIADKRVNEKIVWGNNEALCNSLNMADSLP